MNISPFTLFPFDTKKESEAFSSATQHLASRKLDWKRKTECLNTKFPVPILLYGIEREAIYLK